MNDKPKIEYHYAPLTGDLIRVKNGNIDAMVNWESQHALMEEFLSLRANDQIKILESATYGHILFHGHSGRVDIYG